MPATPRLVFALVLALAQILGLAFGSTAASYAAGEEVDVRAEVRRFSSEFRKARTANERLELVRGVPAVGDERIARALIDALERVLDIQMDIQKDLDKARSKLAPYLGRDLLEAEWVTRDKLEAEVGEVGRTLMEEAEVALALVERLVELESDEVVEFLADWGLRQRSWRIRAEVIRALGKMGGDAARDTVVIATEDKDPRVRQAAVEEAGKLGGEGVVEYVIRRLEDEEWPVRAAAVRALAELESREAVGPLILALGRERGRLRDDCVETLERLTGQTFGDSVRAWRDWWVENHMEELDISHFPTASRKAVSFHDVQTSSKSILFVVDISDSMNEDASSAELTEGGIGQRDGVDRSKFDVMMKELIRTIGALPEEATFNIIVYNHEVRRWQDKMQQASKRNKNSALEFLFEIEPSGGTNIFDALELAFETAGLGAQDRYYRPLVETIYFLSDGAPSAGRITDTDEILKEIDRLNRFRRISILAIGVGKLHDQEFMKSLARQNGGRYVQRL